MQKGTTFTFEKSNSAIPFLTISEKVTKHATIFSLGEGTSITKESYPVDCLLIGLGSGDGFLEKENRDLALHFGGAYLSTANELLGKKAKKDPFLYFEWRLEKENSMNPLINKGEVFALKNLLPYQEGKVINLTVADTPSAQLAVLSLGEGCELAPHKAPGEALLIILDGEGVIFYEGFDHPVKAGDSFCFAKGGLHGVKATTDFKFALFLEKGN